MTFIYCSNFIGKFYFSESVEERQKTALERWQNFDDQLEAHMKWFRSMEAAFRDQQLQPTLKDKEARLRTFKEKREIIAQQEREIDEFVDKSHSLLHASGIERIKPLISQVSNRYVELFPTIELLSSYLLMLCNACKTSLLE